MILEKISFQHRLEYWGYTGIEKLICSLPDSSLPTVSRWFAILAYRILGVRKKVTLENLRTAFPGKSQRWHERIAFLSYVHFAQMMLEFMKLRSWSPGYLLKKVTVPRIGEYNKVMAEGKGIIVVSAHFGNWEMGVGYFAAHGHQSAVIQNRQKNRLVNARMAENRQRWGIEIIYPKGAIQRCIVALHHKKMVALLGDQDAGKRGSFVPFFNRISSTHIGAAVMHLRTGSPLFFAAGVRENGSRYRVDLTPLPDFYNGDVKQEDIDRITALHTKLLEDVIRQHPEQYFWMHRRWKTQPPEND